MRVLITTGCSFSEAELWPYFLEERIPNLSYKNYGKSGMGNEYISRTVFHSVTELLKSGMESKDILVLCCWTALGRLQNSFGGESNGIPINMFRNHDHLFKNKILHDYDLLLNGLEPIISTQNFLKVNNIDFIFFSMFNLFANNINWQYDRKNKLQIPPNTWNSETIFKNIPTHWKSDSIDYLSTLNENIDWDKWWFCNEKDKVKFGGIAEWVSINDPFNAYTVDDWKLKVIPGHPKHEGHKTFANNVLSKLVLEKIK
tara:strand:- start:13678 stop:14451 length:774 start_codon:yes stop_codon:yes gene_type:complete